MSKLIDAHDLWIDIMMLPHYGDMISSEEVEQAIKDAPAVDAQPVIHGRWVLRGIGGTAGPLCSVCEDKMSWFLQRTTRYCPNCGAKMDGGDVDER